MKSMHWATAQRHVSNCLAARLGQILPEVGGADWWRNLVAPALSEMQRSAAEQRGLARLEDLDLAALLSVALQHAQKLREAGYGDEALRPRLGDVKAARNRHAHAPASGIDARTLARDLHNCRDVLVALQWTEEAVRELDAAWDAAVVDARSEAPAAVISPAASVSGEDQTDEDLGSPALGRPTRPARSGFSVVVEDDAVAARISAAMRSSSFVGIDFGTSTTVASLARFNPVDRRILVEPLAIRQERATGQGIEDHIVPTCVAWRNDHLLFGHGAAELKPELKSGQTIFSSFKMELGADLGPSYASSRLDGRDGRPMVRKPQDAARVFLEWLRRGLEAALVDRGLRNAISYTISVPASFEANQRRDLEKALADAGYPMDRLGFVDEPNAAFLGHVAELSGRGEAPLAALGAGAKRILVFDFGAGTCDVSILQVSQGSAGLATRNLSISRFLALGGDDIDRAVAKEALLPALRSEDGKPFELTIAQEDEDVTKRLAPVAERLKIQCNRRLGVRNVSELDAAEGLNELIEEAAIKPIKLSLRNGSGESTTRSAVLRLDAPAISLGRFSAAMRPFLVRRNEADGINQRATVHDPVDDALRKAGLGDEDLDALLFIGGSAESPLVRRALSDRFGRFVEAIVPRDLRSHVSQGSAFHALHRHGLGVELVEPIVADTISVITLDGGLEPVVPGGTPVPSDRIALNTLHVDREGQLIVDLPFCSGDEDKLIGVIRVNAADRSGFARGEKIAITCYISEEKLLRAEATVAGVARTAEFMNPLANRPLSAAEQSMLRARQAFNKSAARNKGRPSVSAVENYAGAAQAAGEWRIAAEMFEAAERLDPARDRSTIISYCWERAGRKDLSGAWSRRAYERRPGATTAFNLALDRRRVRDDSEFLRLSREALRHNPNHLATLDMLGRHLIENGDREEGRRLLKRCIERSLDLIDRDEADLDDVGRLQGAARALGSKNALARAEKARGRLEPTFERPYEPGNLARGETASQRPKRP